jgi:hypothetical protein
MLSTPAMGTLYEIPVRGYVGRQFAENLILFPFKKLDILLDRFPKLNRKINTN